MGALGMFLHGLVAAAVVSGLLAGCSSGPKPSSSASVTQSGQQSWWKMPTIKLPTIKNPFSSDKPDSSAVALSPGMKGPQKPAAAIPSSVAQAPASPAVQLGAPAGAVTAAAVYESAPRTQQINPGEADALNEQAFKFYSQGKLAEAETTMLRAVALRPYDNQLRNNLGVIYGNQGRTREALEQFRLAMSEADACANVAGILVAHDDMAGARNYLQQALAADPNHVRARQALASLGERDSRRVAERPAR
jgi:tetratricopeptide (TPR) repeat protein